MKNVKTNNIQCTTNLVETVDSKNDSCFLENVIKIENVSSLKKLFRITCNLLRFRKNLLNYEVIKRKLLKLLFPSMKYQKQNIYGSQMSRRKF